jgi:hypothetical protein
MSVVNLRMKPKGVKAVAVFPSLGAISSFSFFSFMISPLSESSDWTWALLKSWNLGLGHSMILDFAAKLWTWPITQ